MFYHIIFSTFCFVGLSSSQVLNTTQSSQDESSTERLLNSSKEAFPLARPSLRAEAYPKTLRNSQDEPYLKPSLRDILRDFDDLEAYKTGNCNRTSLETSIKTSYRKFNESFPNDSKRDMCCFKYWMVDATREDMDKYCSREFVQDINANKGLRYPSEFDSIWKMKECQDISEFLNCDNGYWKVGGGIGSILAFIGVTVIVCYWCKKRKSGHYDGKSKSVD